MSTKEQNKQTTTKKPQKISHHVLICFPSYLLLVILGYKKTDLDWYFDLKLLVCSVSFFSWELYCTIFKPYVVKEIVNSSCCSAPSKCHYQTTSFPPDKFKYTLPFLPKQNLVLLCFPGFKNYVFLLQVFETNHNLGKVSFFFCGNF